MESAELALIPAPGAGHLAPMVELGKALTSRDHRVSVTIFIMELPSLQSDLNSNTQTLLSNHPPPRVRFVHLPLDQPTSDRLRYMPRGHQMTELVEINKPRVADFYSHRSSRDGASKDLEPAMDRPAVFVVDMFCTAFADVANGFGVPSYVFATSNMHFLTLLFYLQSIHDDTIRDFTEFDGSETGLSVPGFTYPLPAKFVPSDVIDKENGGFAFFLDVSRNLRKAKGILVNTFVEFEPYTIACLARDTTVPSIRAVGPILNIGTDQTDLALMTWLDSQPVASVVFLCFGSGGAFEAEQVVEIARALEQSGHRFLWALRRPPPKGKMELPSEYENLNDVLPEGFLDRTKEIGRVIGWAPQVAVLSHPAVGGFVSHCGWNSILESLWCGVPIATWPLYAEQQLNAFEMVKELGLSVDIKLDYQIGNQIMVTAEEIERGIKQLMEGSTSEEIRNKVKVMGEKCRRANVDGGFSYRALGHFIEEILNRPS